jgi:glycosyltransferase involved in cell wall biosynthesis
MHVLLVSQYYWPENFIINRMVSLLVARGLNVTVLTGKPNYPDGKIYLGYEAWGLQIEQHDGATLLRVPIVARGKLSGMRLALNYLSFILSAMFFGPALMKQRTYDVVFVYALSPLLQALPAIQFARRRKVPLVVWVQDLWPESLSATGHIRNPLVLGAVKRLVQLIYRASTSILVQSRAFIAPVAQLSNDPGKIRYYPNMYWQDKVKPASGRAVKLMQELRGFFCVVFAGNLGSAQGLDTIVNAAQLLLPHAHVRIALIGSGSLDHWLAQQREARGLLNLILAGRFPVEDMPAIFSVSHVLLVSMRPNPSLSLTIPSKVQAYLAAGRPILGALDGEGARLIEDAGAGMCVPPGDAAALARGILELVDLSEADRRDMGQKGREYFHKHFAPEALADELVAHLRGLIKVPENLT